VSGIAQVGQLRSLVRLVQGKLHVIRESGILLQAEKHHRAISIFGKIDRLAVFDGSLNFREFVS